MGLRETLTGKESLLVTVTGLPIGVMKCVDEGLLLLLIKLWKRNSVRYLIDTIDGDERFRAVVKLVAVPQMINLEAEEAWGVGSIENIEKIIEFGINTLLEVI